MSQAKKDGDDERTAQLSCFVDKDAKEAAIKAAGKRGVFLRKFVSDALRREAAREKSTTDDDDDS